MADLFEQCAPSELANIESSDMKGSLPFIKFLMSCDEDQLSWVIGSILPSCGALGFLLGCCFNNLHLISVLASN